LLGWENVQNWQKMLIELYCQLCWGSTVCPCFLMGTEQRIKVGGRHVVEEHDAIWLWVLKVECSGCWVPVWDWVNPKLFWVSWCAWTWLCVCVSLCYFPWHRYCAYHAMSTRMLIFLGFLCFWTSVGMCGAQDHVWLCTFTVHPSSQQWEWLSLTHSLSVSCFHNFVRGCKGGVFNALIFPEKTLTTAMLQDVTVTIVSDEPWACCHSPTFLNGGGGFSLIHKWTSNQYTSRCESLEM
jgi:hypothetical protein